MPYRRSLADLQRQFTNAYGNWQPTDASPGPAPDFYRDYLNPSLEAGGGNWKDLGNGQYELPDFDQSDWVESLWPTLATAAMGNVSSGFGLSDFVSGTGQFLDPNAATGAEAFGQSALSLPGAGAGAGIGSAINSTTGADILGPEGLSMPSGLTDVSADITRLTDAANLSPEQLSTIASSTGLSLADIPAFLKPSAGLSLVGNLVAAGVGAFASLSAAGAQEKAAGDALGLQRYMYDTTRADFAPWREAGAAAVGRMNDLTTPGKQFDTAMLDPGYAFRQGEGEKAIARAAAARGLWDSGPTYKALDRYNQDYATGEFGNVFNRNAALAGMGQTATGSTAAAGGNYATNAGNVGLQAGNVRASGYMGGANALAGGLQGYINSQNPYWNNPYWRT